jgi:hypothetical protein
LLLLLLHGLLLCRLLLWLLVELVARWHALKLLLLLLLLLGLALSRQVPPLRSHALLHLLLHQLVLPLALLLLPPLQLLQACCSCIDADGVLQP